LMRRDRNDAYKELHLESFAVPEPGAAAHS
jgi:hypothetical protein